MKHDKSFLVVYSVFSVESREAFELSTFDFVRQFNTKTRKKKLKQLDGCRGRKHKT